MTRDGTRMIPEQGALVYEDLRELVVRVLGDLVDRHGFAVVDYQDSPERFGNASVVLQSSGPLRLRVGRDKGQLFVDFGSTVEPDYWLDVHFVLDHVLGPGRPDVDDPLGGISLEPVGAILAECYQKLDQAFSPSAYAQTKSAVRRLHAQWMHSEFGFPLPKDL
jgi:hypothetical protein